MRTGWKHGYKIVARREFDRKWISMTGDRLGVDHRDAVYTPGEDTVPPLGGGPLAVFTDRNRALAYAREQDDNLVVWSCVYLPTDRVNEDGHAIWTTCSHHKGLVFGSKLKFLPQGTACADAVRLITRITVAVPKPKEDES